MRNQLYYQLSQLREDALNTKKEAYARALQKYVDNSEKVSERRIKEIYNDITSLAEGILQEEEKPVLLKYEKNPVFRDAITKKISISDTFQELYKVNEGIKKFLPRKINPAHNKRSSDLNELVNLGNGLKTRGLLSYDSVANTTAYIAALHAGLAYLLSKTSEKPIDFTWNDLAISSPFIMIELGLALTAVHIGRRNVYTDSVWGQAKYLDERINLHFK